MGTRMNCKLSSSSSNKKGMRMRRKSRSSGEKGRRKREWDTTIR